MKKIVPSIFLLVFVAWECVQYFPVKVSIKRSPNEEVVSIYMPFKDKKRLDYFFRDVCYLNTWAYTCMGSKPMSINHYTKPWVAVKKGSKYIISTLWSTKSFPSFRELCYIFNPVQLKLKLGLDSLKKYMKLFPNSRFALLSEDNEFNDIVWFALVNKENLINVVKSNFEDFQQQLNQQEIEPDELYDNEKLSIFVKNLRSDSLIGIVLGYGKNNSALYEKYRENSLNEWPMVSMWADEDGERLVLLHKKELSFQSLDVTDLFYPYFACDPESEETKALKKIYREEREIIFKYYEGQDVVEATFSLLNQSSSE